MSITPRWILEIVFRIFTHFMNYLTLRRTPKDAHSIIISRIYMFMITRLTHSPKIDPVFELGIGLYSLYESKH